MNATNSSGVPATPSSIRSSGKGSVSGGDTYEKPYNRFQAILPAGSKGVVVTLSQPTFEHNGITYPEGGIPYSMTNLHSDLNEAIPLRVRSIHTKFTGRLFR